MPVVRNIWPYPVGFEMTALEKRAVQVGFLPGYCCVCGGFTVFKVDRDLRESVPCLRCRSVNRQRQLATVLLEYARTTSRDTRWSSIGDIAPDTTVWNAESTRALHAHLARRLGANYTASEYLSPELSSGDERDGVLHVDMQNTHFDGESLDFILSSEILEHIPDPLAALEESFRVLKPGGCHIFTAPFYQHRFTNEQRAFLDTEGRVTHVLRPWYHVDLLHGDGALVYNVFAPELMCQLEKIGFEARLCSLRAPFRGLLGWDGIVLVARKVVPPNHLKDGIFTGEDADWPNESP